MTSDGDSLGACPRCGTSVGPAYVLVSYERSDDSTSVFAECPSCGAVVTPE
ncbi:hypothetical protein C475_19053 [Halosimplex carlsbadense 2-9-1]|uniref:DUF7837 domain-containing protein n=1 Tax=Halosimplex carlsbadense 2-9-1 TaxID=797114 RepID=M0CFF8_9EURY|nr:hypothetical protein C475_19053 [Halosimplex carlsbadense 2-9-1]